MKIFNGFGGIGGNRSLWGNEHQITMVEKIDFIAAIYKNLFPDDTVIVGDALEHLRRHLHEYDLIFLWPPCQTHSKTNIPNSKKYEILHPIPDDRSLYGSIRWLKQYCLPHQLWCVENVKDYLGFLIPPNVHLGRNYYWSNFIIPNKNFPLISNFIKKSWKKLAIDHDIPLSIFDNVKVRQFTKSKDPKRTILRNCVDRYVGKYLLDCAINRISKKTRQKILCM